MRNKVMIEYLSHEESDLWRFGSVNVYLWVESFLAMWRLPRTQLRYRSGHRLSVIWSEDNQHDTVLWLHFGRRQCDIIINNTVEKEMKYFVTIISFQRTFCNVWLFLIHEQYYNFKGLAYFYIHIARSIQNSLLINY